MTTITLPPEIEEAVARQAARQGTTPEILALDALRRLFPSDAAEDAPASGTLGKTLYDRLKDHVGVLQSSEHVPGGAQMATNSGQKFADGMVRKRREGRL